MRFFVNAAQKERDEYALVVLTHRINAIKNTSMHSGATISSLLRAPSAQ